MVISMMAVRASGVATSVGSATVLAFFQVTADGVIGSDGRANIDVVKALWGYFDGKRTVDAYIGDRKVDKLFLGDKQIF
jgi:hypothetical protein